MRDNCLKALKERLIERANIIQQRYDDENAALVKRQAAFQRDREQLGPEEQAEHERLVEATTLRINVWMLCAKLRL